MKTEKWERVGKVMKADWLKYGEPVPKSLALSPLSLNRERTRLGFEFVARAKYVITDRLHGHILCVMLGIPHAVLENSYGKIGGVREKWTGSWKGARRIKWDEVEGIVNDRLEWGDDC